MGFSCENELRVLGGATSDRQAAAALIGADAGIDEESLTRETAEASLVLRFRSLDSVPEELVASVAAEFPALTLTLAYFSKDGEFFGYARLGHGAGGAGNEADSEDFDDHTLDEVGRRYGGDGTAFVRARFGLDGTRV